MVVSIIMIVLAFAWLMYETNWLTVRLESTEYQRAQLTNKAKRDFGNMPMGKVKDITEDTESLYQPSQFIPLDMPAATGELNIVCQRGVDNGKHNKS